MSGPAPQQDPENVLAPKRLRREEAGRADHEERKSPVTTKAKTKPPDDSPTILVRATANFVRAFNGDKVVGVALLNESRDAEWPGWEIRFSLPTKAAAVAFLRRLPEIGGVL
jgi:hypothetical protein